MSGPAKTLRYGRKIAPLFPIPALDSISRAGRGLLEQIDCLAGSARESDMHFILQWLAKDPANNPRTQPLPVAVLRHDLSEYFMALSPPKSRPARSLAEIGALSALSTSARELFTKTPDGMQQAVVRIAGTVSGDDAALRSGPVRTTQDLAGNYVLYPPAADVPARLDALGLFLERYGTCAPSFAAMVVMNGICNCHPIADGNGRVSRIVFNAILRERAGTRFYLPLYELAALSDGGFTIRQRQAQYRGDWDPLIAYLFDAARIVLCRGDR
ncbi:MAG: Fic family protein [Rhizomicrobium sp.]